MSVRAGLLTLLTAGPAYGLQLHSELERRTDRMGLVNVGQIYSTLERLGAAGLVTADGVTDDGLPLYAVTDAGRDAAETWAADTRVEGGAAWGEMVFRVLLLCSLRGDAARPVLDRYRRAWSAALEAVDDAGPAGLARATLARAALDWVAALEALPGGLDPLRQPIGRERPRRGRPAAQQGAR